MTKAKSKSSLPVTLTNQRISLNSNFVRAYTFGGIKRKARQFTPKGGIVKTNVERIVRRKIVGIVKSKDGINGYYKRKTVWYQARLNEDTNTWITMARLNLKDAKELVKALA